MRIIQESLEIASERRFYDCLQQHLPHLARSIGSRKNFNARKRRLAPYNLLYVTRWELRLYITCPILLYMGHASLHTGRKLSELRGHMPE